MSKMEKAVLLLVCLNGLAAAAGLVIKFCAA